MTIITLILLGIVAVIIITYKKRSRAIGAVVNAVRGLGNDVAESLADPIRDSRLAIQDGEKEIASFRAKLAAVIAANNRLEAEVPILKLDIEKYERMAKRAGEAKNVDDLRDIIKLKKETETKLDSIQNRVTANNRQEDELKQQLASYEQMLDAAKKDSTELEANYASEKMRKDMEAAKSDMQNATGIAGLNKLKDAVAKTRSEAAAWAELNNSSSGTTKLESKYSVDTNAVSDKDMAKYMS